MINKKILIAGGTGFIGSLLTKKLIENNYKVTILSRGKSAINNNFPKDVEILSWNEFDETSFPQFLENFYGIINLAGASIAEKKWTKEYKEIIIKSRVVTTTKLAKAINSSTQPPQVFINASAVGYYGNSGENEVTEESNSGNDFLSEVCKLWESSALIAKNSTRVVLGRIGVVLDKNEGALKKMIEPYKFFAGGPLGSGKQWIPWIHYTDLINLFIFSLEDENISGAINYVSPEPVRMNEFASALGKVMKKPSLMRVPEFSLKLLMGEASAIVLNSCRALPQKAIKNSFDFKYKKIQEALMSLID